MGGQHSGSMDGQGGQGERGQMGEPSEENMDFWHSIQRGVQIKAATHTLSSTLHLLRDLA